MKSLISAILVLLLASPAQAQGNREWLFRVLLDGKEVGNQMFRVWQEQGRTRLETEADMTVKILFATVFRYEHRNEETWDGNCLTEIASDTKSNRKKFSVRGEQAEGYFRVSGVNGDEKLPECVMSFAYWNHSFLQQDRLLNQQDGRYLDVDIAGPFDDSVSVFDTSVPALRYQLNAEKVDLKIWYTPDYDWLALESKTPRGNTLRYEPK